MVDGERHTMYQMTMIQQQSKTKRKHQPETNTKSKQGREGEEKLVVTHLMIDRIERNELRPLSSI